MKRILIISFMLVFATFIYAQNAWINEIHYDNLSGDVNEFIEIVIENAGSYSLSDFTLTLYRDVGTVYDTKTLDQFTEGSTVDNFTIYSYTFPQNGIQNGPADGMCLDYQGTVISGQLLSYEGTLSASEGPAAGMTSTDIGVEEPGWTSEGKSLQLGGSGIIYDAFTWQDTLTATLGEINANQTFSSVINPEPSNHVTGFTTGTINSSSIQLKWTGATGDQLPSRYLILGSMGDKAFATVQDTVPVANDADWSDSTFALNITHHDGPDSIDISGLDEFTTYDFKIYPYTNSGSDIDFKTDGDIPETSGETAGLLLTAISTIRQDMVGYSGQVVKVSGTVTHKRSSGFYLQDANTAWSGIYVYAQSATSNFKLADTVVIIGTVDEYYDLSEITNLTDWTIIANDANMPKALNVATGDFAQEQYESMLMQVTEAECMSIDGSEWVVDDGSGSCGIDDYLYSEYEPTIGAKYTIKGITNYFSGEYKLAPRSEDDIELITNAPVITEIGVSVKVPLEDEAFVDTVKVIAKTTLSAVKLYYIINGQEAEMDSVDMVALTGDSIFYGEIPESAYLSDDEVEYWVYAEDVVGEKTEGTHHGFFAGITQISIFKQWIDNSELLYDGYYVRTSGVATVGDSIFSVTEMNFYIQDETLAAVNIFQYDGESVDIIPGHQYTITGVISQYGGIVEIIPDDPEVDVVDDGESTLPDPIELNIASLLSIGEELEGLLVKILNVDTVGSINWPSKGNDANMVISDDGGTSELALRLDRDTDISGTTEPTWPQHITGIFGQFDTSPPYTEGYQLIPRSITDFESATAIDEFTAVIPDQLILYPTYPNPFNPAATIPFNIPVDMVSEQVKKLTIYNTLGQVIKEYELSNINAGLNSVKWNGRSNEGNQVASGLYFAVLQISNLRLSTKLLLLK